jgi:hypothetical protein
MKRCLQYPQSVVQVTLAKVISPFFIFFSRTNLIFNYTNQLTFGVLPMSIHHHWRHSHQFNFVATNFINLNDRGLDYEYARYIRSKRK